MGFTDDECFPFDNCNNKIGKKKKRRRKENGSNVRSGNRES